MPDQLKLPFALWTRAAVRELIRQKFGLVLPLVTVGLYLDRWDFTAQRPWQRALERRPAEVQHWLEQEYPVIAKRAKAEGALILWGDETGVKSEPVAGKSYAPRGKTPVVTRSAKRFGLNMISAVGNRGELRFMLYRDTLNAEQLIVFLKRLVRNETRKVFLILDNLKVHHSQPVRDWLAANTKKIEVFFLPAYSPELNPDEYINGQLKSELRSRPAPGNLDALERAVLSVMRRLQKMPQRILALFKHPAIAYAA
jgi:transposase